MYQCCRFLVKKLDHIMCGGSRVVRDGVGPMAKKKGSMELEWSEVCILARKATIPSKGFLIHDITAGKNK
jgi:hypothetical protein